MNHSRINAKNITTQAHIYYYRFLCTYMVNCVQNISVYVYECVFVFILLICPCTLSRIICTFAEYKLIPLWYFPRLNWKCKVCVVATLIMKKEKTAYFISLKQHAV